MAAPITAWISADTTVRPRCGPAAPAAIALAAALAQVIVLAAAIALAAALAPVIVLAAAAAVKKLQLVRLAAGSPAQARVRLAAVAMLLPAAVAVAAPLRPRRHAVIRA